MNELLTVVFILILFFSVSLQRVFRHQSANDLKKRARHGDVGAKALYKLAAHGNNLILLLWFLIVISATISCVYLAELFSFWPAFIVIVLILWLSFVWFPNSKVSQLELITTSWVARPLSWLLDSLRKPLSVLDRLFSRTGMGAHQVEALSRELIIKTLISQKKLTTSQTDASSIDMAINALTFEEKRVEDVMTPRSALVTVNAKDDVGPVLIDELHKSGASRFVVYQDKVDNIIGTLRLDSLVNLKKSGRASSLMDHKVCYIHEDASLHQVISAFYKTQQHLFVVVNRFEDFVGVISLEDVLSEIIGSITDEFDDYHDKKSVAASRAAAIHVAREAVGSEPDTEHVITVIE